MRRGGAVRGLMTAWLGLIALHTLADKGSGRVGEFLGDVDRLLQRALDPTIPAIPDLRNGETWGSGTGTTPARWQTSGSAARTPAGGHRWRTSGSARRTTTD